MTKYDDLRRMRERQFEEDGRDAAIARRRLAEIKAGGGVSALATVVPTSRKPRRKKARGRKGRT